MNDKDSLDAARMNRDLPPGFELGPVIVEERLESTNTALRDGALSGRYEPGTVLAANEQTAGRGRMQRAWAFVPGKSLAFSVLAPNPAPESPGFISVGAALAVAEAAEDLCGVTATVKWPNDVYIEAGKAAGILAEALQLEGKPFVVVGFGLNVNATPDVVNRSEELAVTSLLEVTGVETDRERLLCGILVGFSDIMETLRRSDRKRIAEGLRRRSLLVGRNARFLRSRKEYRGKVAGHTDDLGILLETPDARITLPGEGTELLELLPPATP
jgi:BirA family biotin operon repressor/biotin-[acetyl-CoA-carboxylase] ligase